MSLDVVVVTYNSADHLAGALEPLPPDARVIVVDNASTDGSADLARRLGAEVVERPVNAGFAAAADLGAAQGTGDLVLFLNPDARIDSATLSRLCRRLHDAPDLAVVSPRVRRPDGSEQRAWWPFPSASGAWREALGLHRLAARGRGDDAEGFVIGACFLARRAAFEALGGFDTRFWLYSEETDLCLRARRAGWRVELADDLVADHVGGASGAGVEGLVFEHFERGGEHLVAKHDGPRALVSYRVANLAGALARSLLPGPPARRDLHRARARRLARQLRRAPATVPLDSPATAASGAGLVVCSLEAWDEVWRRNQLLVRELLERDPDRRVLFVEPAFDRVHERRHPSGRRRRRGLAPVDGDGRVVRFEPGKVWPRVLGGFADRSLRRQVRRAAASLGFVDPTLWVNDPAYAGLAGETRWTALYDITDDWAEAGRGGRAARRVRANESTLFDECGAVVVCSEGLARSRRAARPDLAVIPNAVDGDHLALPRERPADLPGGPVAVYVGTLHEDRLDLDVVEALAARVPDLDVVLLGPDSLTGSGRRRLAAHANVHLLGPRPYADVPAYLQHADVVVVPHVVSAFTESLDPIKAYECLAVGRPTVATPVAGFRDLGDPVRCVPPERFADEVAAILDAGPVPSRPRPVPSWADRAAAFDRELAAARARAPRPLRVVYVDHCAQLSGAELALARVLPALSGVDAHVILGEHGPLEELLRGAGATVEVLALDQRVASTHRDEVTAGGLGASRALAAGRDTAALARRLRALEPDLVHTNSLKAALYGGLASRLAGVPVVWHIRDRISADYLPFGARWTIRALARTLPTTVLANSDATRVTLGRFARAGVIASPVVHDAVAPMSGASGHHATRFRVAMVGRLAPWKGQHVFVEAFARAFPDGDEQAIVVGSAMFGEDAYEAELRALVEKLDLVERVELVGFVDDVASVLRGVDCLVHASVIPEPFGQVVIEGMAAGLAVIASAEGGPAEVITDGVDGLLCPPDDVDALARRLRRVADDPELRHRLGAAARLRAEDFAPARVAAQVRSVYDDVVRRGARRR